LSFEGSGEFVFGWGERRRFLRLFPKEGDYLSSEKNEEMTKKFGFL